MAGVSKAKLSGSTDGRGILIVATTTPGTLVHTAVTGTTAGTFDEVWVYVQNDDIADRTVTLEWGGTTGTDQIVAKIPFKAGRYLMVDGGILQNGVVVRAFCDSASVCIIHGFVNAITA